MQRDLIILNANIQTMDVARPQADAILIRAGRIVALGTASDLRPLAGKNARIVDAGGRLVLPGFQDAHVHLMDGGTDIVQTAWLGDATTITEMQVALHTHAAKDNSALVMGGGWNNSYFNDENLTRAVLDAVLPDRPCIVYDDSAHSACLNSAACIMAGVTRETPDPPNGHFLHDAAGEPTGMLYEDAIYWARARLPHITDATYLAGARAGQAHANSLGITGVLDPCITSYQERAYATLAAHGGMTLRVAGAAKVDVADTADTVIARLTALRDAHQSDYFRIQSAKFFLDGILENRTAAMIASYADAAGGNAPLMFAPDHLTSLFTAVDAARFQIHVHVIGDLAVRATLDGLTAALHANGAWPSLHQLAHLQVIDPADIPRIAALGAMANIQPLWACNDPAIPDPAQAMIGHARAPNTYAFRRMLDAGAAFCLSSDWPVTTLNPFEIIEVAATRQPVAKKAEIGRAHV